MYRFAGRLGAALALAAGLLVAHVADAAGQVRRGPAPAWVVDAQIPSPRAERVREVTDGYYNLLADYQDRPDRTGEVRYVRQAYKVIDRSGLEGAARIDILFDPASEDVVLHHVRVWRDGKVQDRLGDLNIQIIRREKELDKGVFDGRKTAHLELSDVRVGDIVDYAYSEVSDDPLMAGTYQGEVSTAWSSPVEFTRYRLLWPHGAPITVRTFAGAPQAVVTPGAEHDEYVWRVVDPAPRQKENSVPGWLDQWGRVSVSSMTSWAQVVNWSLPFYNQSEALTPDWTARVDAIARKYSDPRDRITEALRLVQDDIRYVSLSIGAGGYRPRAPAVVIRSGYGDCKDKALLLSAILRRLGVAAVPALTDSNRGRAMPGEAPSTNNFDHAIVRIDYGGKAYWVDPTGSLEGGRFPHLSGVSYGWALPIRPGQTALEEIPLPAMPAPTIDIVERYDLARGADPDMRITVTSTYRDDGADGMRGKLASNSLADLETKYLQFYAGLYPGVERLRPVEVSDARDANVLTIREAYRIPPAALAKVMASFPIKASGLTTYKSPDPGVRRMPFWADYPVNDRHRVVISTPGRRPQAPDAIDLDGKAFHLVRAAKREGDVLTITSTLVGTHEVVEPGDADTYRTEVDSLSDGVGANLNLASRSGGGYAAHAELLGSLVLTAASLVLVVASIFAVRSALHADDAWAAEGQFYPVSSWRFVGMSVATAGLYGIFWRWKYWRWEKQHGGRDIAPFWRTLFAVFWQWALFRLANDRLAERRLPAWIGIAAAVGVVFWAVANSAVGRWPDAPTWLKFVLLFAFVCDLPGVVAVERLNGPQSAAAKANSRFTWHTAAALGGGLFFWILIAIGWDS